MCYLRPSFAAILEDAISPLRIIVCYSIIFVKCMKMTEFKSNCLLAGSCTDSTLYKTFWGLNTHIRRHHTDFFSNPADSQGSMTNEDQLLGWFYNHFNHKITWITIFILVSNEDFLGAVENNTDSGENVASLEQLTHSAGISTWKSSFLRGLNNLRVVVFNTSNGGFLIRG